MTELETLLRQYAEGTISQEGLQRLNTLSHRDEVLAGAAARANTLRRQRAARMSVVASVAVVVAVVVAVALRSGTPAGLPDAVMEAALTPQPAVVTPVETLAEPAPVHHNARPAVAREVARAIPVAEKKEAEAVATALQETPAPVQVHEEPPAPTHIGENYPEVACNSECSPDSVINDIWRFLRV